MGVGELGDRHLRLDLVALGDDPLALAAARPQHQDGRRRPQRLELHRAADVELHAGPPSRSARPPRRVEHDDGVGPPDPGDRQLRRARRRPPARPRPAAALSAPVMSTTRPRAASTTGGVSVIRTRPWYSPDEVDGRGAVDDRIAGRPRRGVPVGAHAEVDDVEAVREGRRRTSAAAAAEVGRRDRHQVVVAGDAGELAGVAVGVAVGRDALVDLPDVDGVPRQVRRRRARRASAAPSSRRRPPARHGPCGAPPRRSRRAIDRAARRAGSSSTRTDNPATPLIMPHPGRHRAPIRVFPADRVPAAGRPRSRHSGRRRARTPGGTVGGADILRIRRSDTEDPCPISRPPPSAGSPPTTA